METLRKTSLFWDVSVLDATKDTDFIIGRILNYWVITEDFAWALGQYGQKKVEEVLRQTRQLDKKSRSFWCGFFHMIHLHASRRHQ